MCTVPYAALEAHTYPAQLAVWHGAVWVLAPPADLTRVAEWAGPYVASPDPVLLPLATRLELRMRLGCLGLPTPLEDVAPAAFASAVRLAEVHLGRGHRCGKAGGCSAVVGCQPPASGRALGAGPLQLCSPPPPYSRRYDASAAAGISPLRCSTAAAASVAGGHRELPMASVSGAAGTLQRLQGA